MKIPEQANDIYEFTGKTIDASAGLLDPIERGVPGFNDLSPQPGSSGNGTRFKNIPNSRTAVFTRNVVKWFIPEVGIIEMYINPQSIKQTYKKDIKETRTKGGYLLQYWGEELSTLIISGTTGSSGVEGINVLEDIYRSEQLAFDPYALALAQERDAEAATDQFSFFGDFAGDDTETFFTNVGANMADIVGTAIETGNTTATRSQPTLADLAFSVEMYWSGWAFRGYFIDFTVDESADKLGLFNYSMTFKVTQRRGLRTNFLGWHRSAIDGQSNSDPNFGVPYSYSGLVASRNAPVPAQTNEGGKSFGELLGTEADLFGGGISSIF